MEKLLREERFLPKEEDGTRCVKILEKALKEFQIPQISVAIGGYAEEAICLEEGDSGWRVYGGERGEKYNMRVHAACRAACRDVLSRLADSVEAEREWLEFFDREYESSLKK